MAISPDGKLVACAVWSGGVRIHEVRSLRLRALLTGHRAIVGALAWSPDSKQLAVALGGPDKPIRIWSVDGTPGIELRRKRREKEWHRSPSLSWSPDGKWIGGRLLGRANPVLAS